MVTILDGLAGGLVATIAMTAFMMAMGDDSPPPTALFWSKYVGEGTPDDYAKQGLVLHLLYGIAAGGVFGAVLPYIGVVSVTSIGSGLLWGSAYGVLLFLGAAGFWMPVVLGMDPDAKMAGTFLFFHLVYGVTLGGWIGYGPLG